MTAGNAALRDNPRLQSVNLSHFLWPPLCNPMASIMLLFDEYFSNQMNSLRHSRFSPLPGGRGDGAKGQPRSAPDTPSMGQAVANKRKERPSNLTDRSQ